MNLAKWLFLCVPLLCGLGCASMDFSGSDRASLQKGMDLSQAAAATAPDETPGPTTTGVDHAGFWWSQDASSQMPSEESLALAALYPQTSPLLERGHYQKEQSGLGQVRMPDDQPVDLGIGDHPRVDYFVKSFQEDRRNNFKRGLARSTKYLPMMRKIFSEEGLPEQLLYIALVESAFNPHAYSHRGAGGIWQFMVGTGRKFGLRIDWWLDERRDPEKSTRAAANYLRYLYGMFGSWDLAIAAYNAGEGTIERCVRRSEEDTFWGLCDSRGLKGETKNFVPKFLAASRIAMDPAAYGFVDIPYEEPLACDVVSISDPLGLDTIARLVGATEEEIREMNPQLRRWCSPPGPEKTELRIPKGTADQFNAGMAKLSPGERTNIKVHRVHRGESLWTIARRYGSRVDLIQRFNRLPSASRIRTGATLMIPLPNDGGHGRIVAAERGDAQSALVASIRTERSTVTAGDGVIVHRVRRGDSLWSISRKYGVRITDILRWNSLGSHRIRPGETLTLIQKET